MKKLVGILIFALLILGEINALGDCSVEINTNVKSSVIYVDDNYLGNGAIKINLPNGIHVIKIKESLRNWDAQLIQDTLMISDSCESITLEYNFEKKFFVDTEPQDAFVYKNDQLAGHTPMFFHNGVKEITLVKKDYKTRNIKLDEIAHGDKVKLDFTGQMRSPKFTESVWFKVLIGSAVALGATAAHFKIQADEKYEEYLKSTNAALLDETDKLDLYSGIAFGALQINFGVLIYILLTE